MPGIVTTQKFAIPDLGVLWTVEELPWLYACSNSGCRVDTLEELVYVLYEDDERFEVRMPLCRQHLDEVQAWWRTQGYKVAT